MTDVLSPISYALRPPREARTSAELSRGLGWLLAAWISLGIWTGLIAASAGLLALMGWV